MTPGDATVIICMCMFLLIASLDGWLYSRRRAPEMREMAISLGFEPWGADSLPKGLSLAGTRLATYSRVWNVFALHKPGQEIVVFDCRIGQGKHAYSRTVLAAYCDGYYIPSYCVDASLGAEPAGIWTVYFEPHGSRRNSWRPFTPVPLLEIQLRALMGLDENRKDWLKN